MIVDVHAHCYPEPYLKELKRLGIDEGGGVGITIPQWSSAEERIEDMDVLGVNAQVLSLSAPSVYFQDPDLSKALAQMTNDFIADTCQRHPDRFLCFASIPMNSLKNGIDELHRAINDLGMDGVVLGTNINQRSLAEDEFLPFFEAIDQMKIPVALHPIRAIGQDLMPAEDVRLTIPSNVGFLFETTRTIAQMVFKGTFEKYKNLTFILPHSGGAIPFVYPRWDISYKSRPDSHPLKQLPNLPSHYLKNHYYDTALAYYHSSLRCTIELADVDHVLFGTDSPYTITDFRAKDTIEKIESYGFLREEKEKIYFRNAISLFPKITAMIPKPA